jgi:peptide/nickel transport system substrate-binding protein
LAAVANLPIRSQVRLTGVIVSVITVAGMLLFWRSLNPPKPEAAIVKPTRGGALTAAVRTDPRSFNRLIAADETTGIISLLINSPLVRINRASFELEPWLAEKWESSADGREHTLHLREGLRWSDGQPLTSADVLFTVQVATDKKVESAIVDSVMVAGEPIQATAPDEHTVVFRFAGPSGPGLRLLDSLPILPRHKLAAALSGGTFREAWATSVSPAEVVGAGPFVLARYEPGQRVVLERNPNYWRKGEDGAALPYLDRIVLEVIPEQNAGMLRLEAGNIDMMQSELRPEDYVAARTAEEAGKLKVVELGVGTDADAFWFCLKPDAKRKDPRFAFVQKREFRQAISHAVDREEFAQTVFLGEAVPIWGPITPGNKPWFSPNILRYLPDLAKARELLKSIGLEDRNGNGIVEDASGTEARFAVITQKGVASYEKGTTVLKDRAAMIGIALDIVPLEGGTMIERMLASDYEAIYMRPVLTDLDPGATLDMWLSSGGSHFWNRSQKMPATEWERRIDTIMIEQAATTDPQRRRDLFNEVQRIFAENLPVLYFAAPRLYYAHSARVTGVVPSVLRPPVLWNADSLGVNGTAAN